MVRAEIEPCEQGECRCTIEYARYLSHCKVPPAIAYGGPDVDPTTSSPESQKIAESGVLIEVFADLSKEELLPKDPIARARASSPRPRHPPPWAPGIAP